MLPFWSIKLSKGMTNMNKNKDKTQNIAITASTALKHNSPSNLLYKKIVKTKR